MRIDPLGSTVIMLGLLGAMGGLIAGGDTGQGPLPVAALVAGAVLVGCFVLLQRRSSTPLLTPSLFHIRSIFCGECGSRLILSNARSSQGVIYPYFLCAGRHSKRTNCERKAMFVPDIEAAVEDYYRRVQIPAHVITALRELILAEFDRLHATARNERHAYQSERDALRDERKKLLQAHYAGVIPLDLLGEE